MKIITRNVNTGLEDVLRTFSQQIKFGGLQPEETRNGKTYVLPDTLETVIQRPQERVLFSATRNANPFFHLMESLWMLAGRDDVRFVEHFVRRMRSFSDDGEVLPGAYGHRWRQRFGHDQLTLIINQLKENPKSRRAVLQMWSTEPDLTNAGKDVCCNLSVVFDTRGERLNAYVMNRSNDVIWGLFGANAVHFSILQEYIANFVGLPVGELRFYSVNAHLYTDLFPAVKELLQSPFADDRYNPGHGEYTVEPSSMFSPGISKKSWEANLRTFFDEFENGNLGRAVEWSEPFFPEVAMPMALAWEEHKAGNPQAANSNAALIAAPDWRTACVEWLSRTYDRRVYREEEKK